MEEDSFFLEVLQETEQTLTQMLGRVGIIEAFSVDYIKYVFGEVPEPSERALESARLLSRMYVKTLNLRNGQEAYTFTEQVMMGLIFGRSKVDRPMPLKDALQSYTSDTHGSPFVKRDCIVALSTGVKNMSKRIEGVSSTAAGSSKRKKSQARSTKQPRR